LKITKTGLLLAAMSAAFLVGAISEKKVRIIGSVQAMTGLTKAAPFTGSPYYLSKTSIFDDLPVRPGDSVFIGDSITALAELQELYGSLRVKNRGINGDTTTGVLHRLSQVYESKPAAVFLLIGINNLQGGVRVDPTVADLRTIVETIHAKSPDTVVFLQPLLPVNKAKYSARILSQNPNVTEPRTAEIAEINTELQSLAKSPGTRFVPLDALLDTAGQLKAEYTEDGLHLNGAGLRAWADIIKGVGAQHF